MVKPPKPPPFQRRSTDRFFFDPKRDSVFGLLGRRDKQKVFIHGWRHPGLPGAVKAWARAGEAFPAPAAGWAVELSSGEVIRLSAVAEHCGQCWDLAPVSYHIDDGEGLIRREGVTFVRRASS